MSNPTNGEHPEGSPIQQPITVQAPHQKRRIMHTLRCALRTTTGRIVAVFAFVGFLLAVYKAFVEFQSIYLDTVPEMHAFASPSDFSSLPFSVKNRSHIFTIKIARAECALIREVTDKQNQFFGNNLSINAYRIKPIVIRPGDIPVNINCPLASSGTNAKIIGLVAIAGLPYSVSIYDFYLWKSNQSTMFTWKNGKWFEGNIF
ncbi:MAG: hypothetical protein ABSG53_07130 [Thermoguttaceae bacterium]|jgi:hypothetical protein